LHDDTDTLQSKALFLRTFAEITAMTASSPLMSTYPTPPVAFVRGEGARLFDTEGRSYLDCLAGIAVNTLGHNHPPVAWSSSRA
jgi:acetylornithine/N-succinyldiaminopimelate aminotransferase